MQPSEGKIHEQASIGFGRAADAYDRGRPEYPAAAVASLIQVLGVHAGARVVELGAGTGKLTKDLVKTGAEIVAVEPVDAMRAKLIELVPGIHSLDGTAEAIPLPDSSVDAVVAAQAFHWFRGEEALAEIGRILKPAGGLGLIWNVRDEAVDWVCALGQITEPFETSVPRYKSLEWMAPFAKGSLFLPLQKREFAHVQSIPADAVEDRIASISFIAALPGSERAEVLKQVRRLVRETPSLHGRPTVEFPYRTDVYWCRRACEADVPVAS